MNKELIKLNRIKVEKEIFEKDIDYYRENGIFLEYDINDSNIVYILYIIKHNNIYKHTQHLFKFTYTDNYPFDPPKLKYLTPKKKARLHPNFYANGKCCLSLLGTWNGPQWTSCNNITSIINSIIPLFTDNPIQFEPTYENIIKHKKINETYNLYVLYESNNLLIDNLENPIDNIGNLNTIMKEYYYNNYIDIQKNINKLENNKNKTIFIPVYNYKYTIDYDKLVNNSNNIYNNIKIDLKLK